MRKSGEKRSLSPSLGVSEDLNENEPPPDTAFLFQEAYS
jgi:hypothetical protein